MGRFIEREGMPAWHWNYNFSQPLGQGCSNTIAWEVFRTAHCPSLSLPRVILCRYTTPLLPRHTVGCVDMQILLMKADGSSVGLVTTRTPPGLIPHSCAQRTTILPPNSMFPFLSSPFLLRSSLTPILSLSPSVVN